MKYFTLLIMALTSLATPGWFSRLRSRLPRWNVLTNSQKVALVSFISLALFLPIITLATLEGTRLASRAVEPVTPPITPPGTPTPTPSSSIKVTSPNGGETIQPKSVYTITWESSGVDQVLIDLVDENQKWSTISLPLPAKNGYYAWTVPSSWYGNSNKFKIRIYGYPLNVPVDLSDSYFTIPFIISITPTPTPRLTATPTPSSTPTPTVTPTVTPTLAPTPTPTPTPTANVAPRIQTWFLPPGRINRNYRANIVGTDRNKNDNLTLTTAGLPTGIIQGPCSTGIQNKNVRISCVLSGRPTVTGIYPVHVVLTDNHGGKTENDIFIIIYNFFGLF